MAGTPSATSTMGRAVAAPDGRSRSDEVPPRNTPMTTSATASVANSPAIAITARMTMRDGFELIDLVKPRRRRQGRSGSGGGGGRAAPERRYRTRNAARTTMQRSSPSSGRATVSPAAGSSHRPASCFHNSVMLSGTEPRSIVAAASGLADQRAQSAEMTTSLLVRFETCARCSCPAGSMRTGRRKAADQRGGRSDARLIPVALTQPSSVSESDAEPGQHSRPRAAAYSPTASEPSSLRLAVATPTQRRRRNHAAFDTRRSGAAAAQPGFG